MKSDYYYLGLLFIFLNLFGCRSSETNKELVKERTDTFETQTLPEQPQNQPLPAPTTIKPNSTFIGAQIDRVEVIDDINFRLFVFIGTAIPEINLGLESFAEAGQTLVLLSQYETDPSGKVDLNSARNKKIYALRYKEKGDAFIGRISLKSTGEWVLYDVEHY